VPETKNCAAKWNPCWPTRSPARASWNPRRWRQPPSCRLGKKIGRCWAKRFPVTGLSRIRRGHGLHTRSDMGLNACEKLTVHTDLSVPAGKRGASGNYILPAILAARCYTGSTEIVALRHSYHGRSAMTMALTGQAARRVGGAVQPGIVHAHNAYCYRCPFGLTYPSCDVRCARDVEEVIRTEAAASPWSSVLCPGRRHRQNRR